MSHPHPLEAAVAAVAIEDLAIPSDTAGIALHLRHKWVPASGPFTAERTVVLVHGATYASGSLFDVRLDGLSFLDHLALAGLDVFALDVRGYGGSTRPPEMERPPEHGAPIVRTETGVRDLSSAVDFVRARGGFDDVGVVGMSWGGSVAGAFTAAHPEAVSRLALVAPQWLRRGTSPLDAGGPLGAYRNVVVADMEARWRGAAPADRAVELIPPGWFERWVEACLASDPSSAATGVMRAVNGPVADIREHWSQGRPVYDPGEIRTPVLLVHGEWDIDVPLDAAQAYFLLLRSARYRRWVEIGEATHMVLLERQRTQAFRAISTFLTEADPTVVQE
jgi:pimeloyl-ACP methyl ester carboxylesterase